MRITDLTDVYKDLVIRQNRFEEYVQTAPSLFAHYFSYWAKRPMDGVPVLSERDLQQKQHLLRTRLPIIEETMVRKGLRIHDLSLVLFVGQGTSNGHAFLEQGKSTVWIPVEAYETEKQVDVFVTHEIVHALHYQARPEFFFTSKKEQQQTGRQFLTEGMATCLTKHVLDCGDTTALWADYLPPTQADRWMSDCKEHLSELGKVIYEQWNESPEQNELFLANDPNNIFKYRSGYFAGLWFTEEFMRRENLRPQDLLQVDRKILEQQVRAILLE